ncbi:MazG nucleotide pyrophosphohydrolase domain-containing protein [Clostridium intestinale]|uniref:Nucleotide pyrophosphohydrolase n=1 Tax=Clostridium intestinale TaxID=36845 RepID=A0A7D6ZMH4_9CLOT|nr:MazG-like family protein [Clostridium intestinale]QLY77823.1 nucleotide pyrophosphohydrolase [Clostridium intestinale]
MIVQRIMYLANSNAEDKGFWEDYFQASKIEDEEVKKNMLNNAMGNRLMLIVSEVAEAQEALRKSDFENFAEELADIVIRVCDLSEGLNIDLEQEIVKKIEKNKSRPYKHGKEF